MSRIYLDNAAATSLDERVLKAMMPFFSEEFHNPSALYKGAREAKQGLEQARELVAKTIGAKPSEVIFTAGGTESANLAVKGVMKANPDGHLVVSKIEHDAVLKPSKNYKNTSYFEVDEQGVIDLEDLKSKIQDNTVLVSVIMVNNEVGTIQPIKKICDLTYRISDQVIPSKSMSK